MLYRHSEFTVYSQTVVIFQEDGDIIIELCHDIMPDMMADVLLFSRVKNFSPELGVSLLKRVSSSGKKVNKRARFVQMQILCIINNQIINVDHYG